MTKNHGLALSTLAIALGLNLTACASGSETSQDSPSLSVRPPDDKSVKSAKRTPASALPRIPTAEDLFARGLFSVRKAFYLVLDENHFGQPLDLSERRPAVDLAATIFAEKYHRPGSRLIGNFFHRGRFYVVRVPNSGVRSVYFQLAYFPPIILRRYVAAHSLLRYEMNPESPVQLVAEMPSVETLDRWKSQPTSALQDLPEPLPESEDTKIYNVAISAEAQWTQNDPHKKYDLLRGSRGAFIQVVRFVSLETRYEEFFRYGNPVGQMKYSESPEIASQILNAGLEISQRDGLTKLYDTFWYNCTTLAFDIVEAVVDRDRRLGFLREFFQRRVPPIAPMKIGTTGGLEVSPMQLDRSLIREAQASFQSEIESKRRTCCTKDHSAAQCETIASAVLGLSLGPLTGERACPRRQSR
jgi:hypothetical protein